MLLHGSWYKCLVSRRAGTVKSFPPGKITPASKLQQRDKYLIPAFASQCVSPIVEMPMRWYGSNYYSYKRWGAETTGSPLSILICKLFTRPKETIACTNAADDRATRNSGTETTRRANIETSVGVDRYVYALFVPLKYRRDRFHSMRMLSHIDPCRATRTPCIPV